MAAEKPPLFVSDAGEIRLFPEYADWTGAEPSAGTTEVPAPLTV